MATNPSTEHSSLTHPQFGRLTDESYLVQLSFVERTALQDFKTAIAESPSAGHRLSDRMLMRILFGRKLDVTRALELLEKHLALRERFGLDDPLPELFASAKEYLQCGVYMAQLSPARALNGAGLTYLIPRNLLDVAPETRTVRHCIRGAHWWSEVLSLDHVDNDRLGFVVIDDLTTASFSTMRKLSADPDQKEIMGLTQDHMPGRVRGIYVLGTPWWVRGLVAAAKVFLKKKLVKKLQFVVTMDDLTEFVDKTTALAECGGDVEIDREHFWAEAARFNPPLYPTADAATAANNLLNAPLISEPQD